MRLLVSLCLALCWVSAANAETFEVSGKVQKIFALDRVISGSDTSHILIAGFSVAGSCPTNDGLIALALRDDEGGRRQLAVSLSAKLSGQNVVVRVDDARKNAGGVCYLQYLEFN